MNHPQSTTEVQREFAPIRDDLFAALQTLRHPGSNQKLTAAIHRETGILFTMVHGTNPAMVERGKKVKPEKLRRQGLKIAALMIRLLMDLGKMETTR